MHIMLQCLGQWHCPSADIYFPRRLLSPRSTPREAYRILYSVYVHDLFGGVVDHNLIGLLSEVVELVFDHRVFNFDTYQVLNDLTEFCLTNLDSWFDYH
jgi:hypothetical protein